MLYAVVGSVLAVTGSCLHKIVVACFEVVVGCFVVVVGCCKMCKCSTATNGKDHTALVARSFSQSRVSVVQPSHDTCMAFLRRSYDLLHLI
jgi:hypothetical protein